MRLDALRVSLAVIATLGLSACTGGGRVDSTSGTGASDLGSARLALQLAPGASLGAVSYAITGPGGFSKTGAVDVTHSSTLSVVVGAIPAGRGYLVTLTATTADGAASCAGSASFDVSAHGLTAVTVHLTCHEAPRTGSVSVTGTINVCPRAVDPMRWYKSRVKFDDVPARFRGQVNVNSIPYNRREGDVAALDDQDIDALVAFLGTLTDAGYRRAPRPDRLSRRRRR
jgi:hypothetical protein